MKYIILLLVLVGCSTPVLSPDNENYYIEIIPGLDRDNNGYYHMTVNQNQYQTLHKLALSSNFRTSTRIDWDANSSWIYNHLGIDFDVPVINGVSYTSVDDGMAYTMFAPVVELVGDTVLVVAVHDNITDEINIILE